MSIHVVYDCMLFFMRAARPDRVAETFELVRDGTVQYCLSPAVIAEIRDVLLRPKHQARFPQLTPTRIDAFLEEILRKAVVLQDVPETYQLERDPKDSKYINLAVAAKAPYLVTRDKDLLTLMSESEEVGRDFRRQYPDLPILSPHDFVVEISPSSHD